MADDLSKALQDHIESLHQTPIVARGGAKISPNSPTESKCVIYRHIVRVQRGHVHTQDHSMEGPAAAKKVKKEKIVFL